MGSRLLCRSNTVLLVVDVQGKLAQRAVGSELLHKRISALVSGCSALKVPVAFTEQLPDKLGSTSESIKAVLESALATRFVKRTFRFQERKTVPFFSFPHKSAEAALEMILSLNGTMMD